MSKNVEIVVPAGMFGADLSDNTLASWLRILSKSIEQDTNEWAEKYSTNFENDIFKLHRYCWCDRWDCGYCNPDESGWTLPNFWHKPSDMQVWWYKYIGRSMSVKHPPEKLEDVFIECLLSLRAEGKP